MHLLDQRVHRFEGRVFGRAQPFEQHHFGSDQFHACAGQAVKRRIAVIQGARTARIGHYPNIEFFLEQFQCGLQQADMGFAAAQHDAGACLLRARRSSIFLQMTRQAAGIARGHWSGWTQHL